MNKKRIVSLVVSLIGLIVLYIGFSLLCFIEHDIGTSFLLGLILCVPLLFPFAVIVYHEELKFPYTERSLLWDSLAVFFTFSTGIAVSVFIHYFYSDDSSAAAFIVDYLFTTGVMLNRFHKIYSKQKHV